jgi:hypothetical protein
LTKLPTGTIEKISVDSSYSKKEHKNVTCEGTDPETSAMTHHSSECTARRKKYKKYLFF